MFNGFQMGKKVALLLLLIAFSANLFAQESFRDKLSDAAIKLTYNNVKYDPSYFAISYPNGDVPPDRGVCTDVIIRAYRQLGIDLQMEIHEDMKENFSLYPGIWGLNRTDKNIDHRRVPNQMTFFERKGISKLISQNSENYLPGDIVAWRLGGGATHIGIIINKKSGDGKRYLVVHNIGYGQEISDCLFDWEIIGHYFYEK